MTRFAVVNNEKLRDMSQKIGLQKICPVNKTGTDCMYFEGEKLFIDEKTCIGCGICARKAPEAIEIHNLPEELTKKPIHRYGENMFALYNLPVPLFGKVTGLLGRNGIGKSTAMKILAGLEHPNFEDEEKGFPKGGKANSNTSTIRDLIDYFKGSEAQAYFEKLERGDIKVSFKPQQVELIPKSFNGTVKQLLEKVDEKHKLDYYVEKLELTHVLEREISQVSGGELQRVAIAACLLKEANVYFLDEPTSYLDIKQRLHVAKLLRELADEDTAVMVIEHDLIVLDYLTDFVHLIYGRPSTYGIVSQIKATKNGINTYLSGFMREENVRFRDHAITFDKGIDDEVISIQKLVSWEAFDKTLGTFQLHAAEGTIHRHDVVGVLGENGIGKTSFVKELVAASKDEQESVAKLTANETITELSLSFKPQYLEYDPEAIVQLELQEAKKYELQLIKPLELEPLMDHQLKDLSGGELQRVMIAKTLAADAHLYVLDEPSAYLDVEQRLSLSKVIRSMMEAKRGSALVIDHDLLFIDHISKRLTVFTGKPSLEGNVTGPFAMVEGMNEFLQEMQITFRRDETNHRPRINKPQSQKDKEQKANGKLYYV
jgi:ATP-binding cassette subfamily E protein 1